MPGRINASISPMGRDLQPVSSVRLGFSADEYPFGFRTKVSYFEGAPPQYTSGFLRFFSFLFVGSGIGRARYSDSYNINCAVQTFRYFPFEHVTHDCSFGEFCVVINANTLPIW